MNCTRIARAARPQAVCVYSTEIMSAQPNFSFEQMAAILDALPDPAFILTRSGVYAAIFGGTDLRYYHDGSGLIGLRMHDVLNQSKADWFAEQIAQALEKRSLQVVEYGLSGCDVKGLEAEGPVDEIWFEGRVQALEFLVQGEEAVLWVASNITQRHQLERQLRQQSETDVLTGLYNRRKLMIALNEQHVLMQRYGTPSAILLFDVDEFKRINDSLGHQMGDQVLIEIAKLCQSILRDIDIAARLGGDEFVVLMPQTSMVEAGVMAQRLRLAVLERLQQLGIKGSISGGLSALMACDEDSNAVLSRADTALYQAKREGRNHIVQQTSV